jgi:hypothetical protein
VHGHAAGDLAFTGFDGAHRCLWHCIPFMPEARKRQNGVSSLATLSPQISSRQRRTATRKPAPPLVGPAGPAVPGWLRLSSRLPLPWCRCRSRVIYPDLDVSPETRRNLSNAYPQIAEGPRSAHRSRDFRVCACANADRYFAMLRTLSDEAPVQFAPGQSVRLACTTAVPSRNGAPFTLAAARPDSRCGLPVHVKPSEDSP